jgi:hypothetical protein
MPAHHPERKKEIVFSIEDNVGGKFKPSIIRNSYKAKTGKKL